MPIIKEAKISVSSTIENLTDTGVTDGAPEVTEARYDGFYKISDGEFLITYREDSEGQSVISDITVREGAVTVKRTGSVHSEIDFTEKAEHKSLYEVKPYAFDMTVFTRKIRSSLTKDGGRLDIYYDMTIGGAQKKVKMRIEVGV